jgi:hypothetical protein
LPVNPTSQTQLVDPVDVVVVLTGHIVHCALPHPAFMVPTGHISQNVPVGSSCCPAGQPQSLGESLSVASVPFVVVLPGHAVHDVALAVAFLNVFGGQTEQVEPLRNVPAEHRHAVDPGCDTDPSGHAIQLPMAPKPAEDLKVLAGHSRHDPNVRP